MMNAILDPSHPVAKSFPFKVNLSQQEVKASFAGCSIDDRKLFSDSRCILPISIMGRKEHEGKRFYATLKLVNRTFKSCTLMVVDSLYRHTLKINHPEFEEAVLWEEAEEAGRSWLTRNQEACRLLTIPHQIIHWQECLSHADFSRQYKIVLDLYETDILFREAINRSVEQYLDRYLNRKEKGVDFNYSQAFGYCLDYLKEECAGMCLWVDGQYDFEVYPTGRSPALAMSYERLIQPSYPTLLKPVSLRFKK